MAGTGVRRATITTIAKRAGVAPCTVSSVLNGQAEKRRIPSETARLIWQEAKLLNYVPNALARGLRQQRTGVIGVVFADFTNNWADRVLNGMAPVLDQHACLPFVLTHHWDPQREVREINSLVERQVDGIITVPLPGNETAYNGLLDHEMPLVFMGDTLESMPQANFVAWGSVPATKLAIRHLLEVGRRRIGYITHYWDTVINRERRVGYEETLRQAGLPMNEKWEASVNQEDQLPAKLKAIFDVPKEAQPDALFVNNDGLAFRTLAVLHEMGVRVPEDVAVIGMGDLPRGDEVGAGLSSVREPCEEIGRLAAETVLELMLEPGKGPVRHVVAGEELKVRRSTVGSGKHRGTV